MTRLRGRVVVVALLACVAACTSTSDTATPPPASTAAVVPTSTPTSGESPAPGPTSDPTPGATSTSHGDEAPWAALLDDPDLQAAASVDDLAAAMAWLRGQQPSSAWTSAVDPEDFASMLADVRIDGGTGVDAGVDAGGAGVVAQPVTVDVDIVMGLPSAPAELVLRTLAVTDATRTGSRTRVTASVDGSPVDVSVEPATDRIVVDLGSDHPDGVVVRVGVESTVPDFATQRVADRGPGGYGLYSDQGGVVALGHWLPVPVAVPGNDGDVPAWGDMGAFAPANWVVDTATPSGHVVTSAVDEQVADGVTRSVGFGLRDVAAAWVPGDPLPRVVTSPDVDPAGVVADGVRTWPSSPALDQLAFDQLAFLARLLGPLPWHEHDLVVVEMELAAGMEFPGMVLLDQDFAAPDERPTEYVMIHELAHQYFHALVGNGSLSDPVVDEPLAQYLSWRWFLETGGEAGAAAAFVGFINDGGEPPLDPPGLPASEFRSGGAYSSSIYRTAATAWVDAAQDHGVEVVDEAIAHVIDEWSLREVDQEGLLATVAEVAPDVADDLRTAFDGDVD